ncbi:MAG: MarR family transcriptional regulator [Blautia sp.]|jgi:DNA-binding transcriptional ArsR family regulator|nr:MarR family transcriptional regulator [Ruminococcus sp. AM41-10BH]RGI24884.1 MarR family transcriptional regulator [Ruminococcus sp. OM08-9BH]
MKEMEYYIAELKEHLGQTDENRVTVDRTAEDAFQDLLISISDAYLEAFERKNLEKMKQLLEEQRNLRKEITKELNRSQNQILIISAKIVDQYNIFNKIYQNLIVDKEIKVDAEFIELRYKNARNIMIFLYRHSHARHKDLMQNLDISKSSLTDTLRVLENAGLVDKIQCDNCAFYDLSGEGRRYLRTKVEDIDREIIIDPGMFIERASMITAHKSQRNYYLQSRQHKLYDDLKYFYDVDSDEMNKEEREKVQRRFSQV